MTSFVGLVLWSPVLQPCRWLDHVQLDHPFEFPASGGLHKAVVVLSHVEYTDLQMLLVATSPQILQMPGTEPINWTDGPVKTCRHLWTPNPRSSSDLYWLHPILYGHQKELFNSQSLDLQSTNMIYYDISPCYPSFHYCPSW